MRLTGTGARDGSPKLRSESPQGSPEPKSTETLTLNPTRSLECSTPHTLLRGNPAKENQKGPACGFLWEPSDREAQPLVSARSEPLESLSRYSTPGTLNRSIQ